MPLLILHGLAGCGDDGGSSPDGAGRDGGVDTGAIDAGRDVGSARDAAGSEIWDAAGWRDIWQLVENCRVLCMDSTMLHDCVVQCIGRDTDDALSEPCADCFAAAMVCTAETGCSDACYSWGTEECQLCRCGIEPMTRNCGQEFRECSGRHGYCSAFDVPGPEACLNEVDELAFGRLYPVR